jgi:hypothetical protein
VLSQIQQTLVAAQAASAGIPGSAGGSGGTQAQRSHNTASRSSPSRGVDVQLSRPDKSTSPPRAQGKRTRPRAQAPEPPAATRDVRYDPELRRLLLASMERVMRKRGLTGDLRKLSKVSSSASVYALRITSAGFCSCSPESPRQEDVRNLRKGQTWSDWKRALQYFLGQIYAEHKASLCKFFQFCDSDEVCMV